MSRERKFSREIAMVWSNTRENASEYASAQELVDSYAREKGLNKDKLTSLTYEKIGLDNWFGASKNKKIKIEEL